MILDRTHSLLENYSSVLTADKDHIHTNPAEHLKINVFAEIRVLTTNFYKRRP